MAHLLKQIKSNSFKFTKINNFDGENNIIEGNAMLHAHVLLPKTFGELVKNILDQ